MSAAADLRALAIASRPVSWINTAYPFAAVAILTTGRVDAAFVVGTLFFLVPYNLLMYGVNDVFDYASDLANPPARAASRARRSRRGCTARRSSPRGCWRRLSSSPSSSWARTVRGRGPCSP